MKALFLDRDGTVNVERHYLYHPGDFELMPGIIDLTRTAHALGYAIIIITNQSGIARGFYSEADYIYLTEHLVGVFMEHGIPITAVYHCPHLDSNHPDRKPNPGMFLRAQHEHGICMADSIHVGDKERDITAALASGISTNYLLSTDTSTPTQATQHVQTLQEVIHHLTPSA